MLKINHYGKIKQTVLMSCTDEALCAVRDYMVSELLGGIKCTKAVSSGYEWTLKDGRKIELRVTIKD